MNEKDPLSELFEKKKLEENRQKFVKKLLGLTGIIVFIVLVAYSFYCFKFTTTLIEQQLHTIIMLLILVGFREPLKDCIDALKEKR
jgi:hypothetical protein